MHNVSLLTYYQDEILYQSFSYTIYVGSSSEKIKWYLRLTRQSNDRQYILTSKDVTFSAKI